MDKIQVILLRHIADWIFKYIYMNIFNIIKLLYWKKKLYKYFRPVSYLYLDIEYYAKVGARPVLEALASWVNISF